jgi:ATP-dependent helicase/DNAse subunit B
VPDGSVAAAGSEKPVAPTALETFAQCPFRYFMGHVLKVGEIERPEEIETITAADVGNVMHAALEEFFNETHPRGDPLAPWSAEERAKLREIAEQHCTEAEHRGLTGKPLAWAADRARILRDLDRFLDADQEFRASGFVFERAEVAFGASRDGSPAPPPARYTLPDGTEIAFRGYIDRVDRGPNGELMVTDYKTGRSTKFKVVGKPDPRVRLDGGKRLQLPVYALALEEEAQGKPISARYWFITERENYEQAVLPLDGPTREAFGDVLQVLADTMRQGYFPAVPGEEDGRTNSYSNCLYCPYDRICAPSQRLEIWKQWKGGPVVREFAALSEGTPPALEGGDD